MALLSAFQKAMGREDLTEEEARRAMLELMGGQAAPELVAGFLVAMRFKRETVAEIVGFARAMRAKAVRIEPRVSGRLVDTCGTGGAPVKSFNVSTAAAFVAAAAGVPIAKHGNRSVTRPSGSADVLSALGAEIHLSPIRVQSIIEGTGIGFLMAPSFHPAVKNAAATRQALQIRTVFNVLGPLNNPAGAQGQVLGVFDEEHVDPMAQVLARLGTEHALVLHGNGLDEATLDGPTIACEVRDGSVRPRTLRPGDYGISEAPPSDWGPLPAAESAAQIRRILAGRARGPRRDLVEYNAGLAVYVGGRAPTIEAGIRRAHDLLETDAAGKKLEEFVAATQRPQVVPS